MPRVIPSLASIATAALLLSACSSPVSSDVHRESEIDVLSFDDGRHLAANVYVDVEPDLPDAWEFTDGGTALGYAEWQNNRLGCSLLVVVASLLTDLPHDLPDGAGSARLTRMYGASNGQQDVYRYPMADGATVAMVSLSVTTGDRGRITLAREFSSLSSVLVIDLECGSGVSVEQILRGLDLSLSVARG